MKVTEEERQAALKAIETNSNSEEKNRVSLSISMSMEKLKNVSDQNLNNIEKSISNIKPPIFWKDKEITKQQIYKWSPKNHRLVCRCQKY